jgi:hypothetical protein
MDIEPDSQVVELSVALELEKKNESLQNKLEAAEKSLQSIYGACYKASQAGLIVTNGDKK